MSIVTASEVVEAFSPAFNSVDLRIVAVKPEDEWINVITSLFPSSKSQEEIEFEQQQSRDKLPNTDRFRILLASVNFKQLRILFEAFKKEEIKVSNTLIKFRGLDPSELGVYPFLPSYLTEMEEWRLVGSEASGTEGYRKNLWPIVDSQNGTARLLGYEDVYELIREILRIRQFDRGTPRDFVIGIPIPARIANVSFIGSALKIKTKKVFGLKDLQLNLYHRRYNPSIAIGYETIWRTTELVNECTRPPARKFCYVTNSVQITNFRPHDMIEVELIHREAPTLGMDKTHLTVPLQNAVEPFAKTLFSFCSLDLFRKRLLNPEQLRKSSKEFENAIAWLLSLIGFSVAPLGRFEKLKIPETNYEVGSIDMIAYRENECILLVDCDTSIPDEKKIRSMMAVKEHFRYIQDEYKRPNIVSVIFSPKDCTGISVDREAVKIVDRHKINRMFEEAMKGNLEEARSSLVYW